MFIAHAFDDAAKSSIILIGALKSANIPAEIHIFGAGGHGFGVRDTGLPLGQWDELCLNWLAWQGFLDAAPLHTFARDVAKARTSNAAALPSFSAVMPKADLNQAFAAQRRVVRLALKDGAQVAGYKAAYATAAAQKTAKVKQPVHGVLFKSGRIDAKDGNSVAVKSSQPLLVETEIGYVMATDIGTKLRVPRQAVTTVESVVPVIELPFDAKTANAKTKAFSAIDTVAGNVGSNQFIVGAPLSPKVVGFTDALVVTLNRDGKKVHATTGADVKDGQAQMLMTLINQIIDQGRVIHRGDIIISGALGGAAPGEKGSYTADFGKLGNLAFTIE
jgi:2-oxo-3-hexenedioate decarboxylase